MKKETAIFAIIAIAAAAFIFGRYGSGPEKGGEEKAATAETSTVAKKSEKSKATKAAAADENVIPVGTSHFKGSAEAPVTIVVFSEFQCPFCRRILPTMKEVEEKYGDRVRVAFKHNPLPFHKDAQLASEAALAAGAQGKFWEMHDKLFENQKAIKRPDLDKYAQEMGLDMTKFKAALDNHTFKKAIDADKALAAKVGARGTPNSFVNGIKVTGARQFDAFKEIIDKQLKEALALKGKGMTADQIYAAMVKKNFEAPKAPKPRKAKDTSKDVYKVPVGNSQSKGPKDALVTIVVFSEFQCPFCSRVLPTTKKIHETYGDKVRVVFKHNPLPFHKDAGLASQATLAAGDQGKFWEMHDKLFANQKALKRENLDAYATELGLNMAKFKAALDGQIHKKSIDSDQALARKIGARGTPNFFINGRKLVGAQPFDAFKKIIDEEIGKAEKLIKAGTPKSQVYAKLTEKGLEKAAPAKPRKDRPRADDKTVYKVPVTAKDASKGSADALVTIVEFSEFQCPFCSRVLPTVKKIHETYGKDVRVVFKHNPLPFHKDAGLASQAALAAGAQGKFWEMHDKLFGNQRAIKRPDLEKYATELELNMSQFKADLDSEKYKSQIDADQALARQIGAGGTPNFFINGRKLVGAQPFESFKTVIDQEIKKAQALVSKGTPRRNVYAELTKNGATKPKAVPKLPAEDDKKVYSVKVDPKDASAGKTSAPITIVEFSDFQCPFSKRGKGTLKQIKDKYGDKVRFVYKHNPLSFHKEAPLAAEAALAAGAQGKFWELHDLMFENQRALKRDDIERYAQEIGLNLAKFKSALDAGTFKAQIQTDIAHARELGATGTPSFFVNGRKLRGAKPFDAFAKIIDEELKK